jgi:hypothetical protein
MMRKLLIIGVSAGLAAAALFAQGPGPGHHMGPMGLGPGPGDFDMLRAEFGMSNKVVTGAPYSAQAVTQFTQALANGDHISRTMTASVARDSQGRTRTDRSIGTVGALAASGRGEERAIVIHDPVAGMSYALDPATKTAHAMAIPAGHNHARPENAAPPPHGWQAAAKVEDLGTQTIQGLSAQGKRETRVIPAGKEGNEKEIDIVTETWYSPELQMLVMSKSSDPRFGDTVYQLNSISRTEPDPALFTVPSDYALKQGRPMMRPGPPPAAQ